MKKPEETAKAAGIAYKGEQSFFKEGFIKRAQEYGMNIPQAETLYKEAFNMHNVLNNAISSAGISGIVGAGLGALRPPQGKTRMQAALETGGMGVLAGGSLGVGVGIYDSLKH